MPPGQRGGRLGLAAASLVRLNQPDADPQRFRDDVTFALMHLAALTTRPEQVTMLRQTILNLAVRGKLVAQNPNDEPASELLKRIAGERESLIRGRIIRGEKPLPSFNQSDAPFSVPKSWVWSKIGDAVLFTQYGTSQKSEHSEQGVPVLTMGNIQDGFVVWAQRRKYLAHQRIYLLYF